MTEKEIYILVGQMNAACIVIHDIRKAIALEPSRFGDKTYEAVIQAEQTARSLRKALRAISYEVENDKS